MFEINIESKSENYSVSIGEELDSVVEQFDAIVADQFFSEHLLLGKPAYWVHSVETRKNLNEVEAICAFFQEIGLTRNSRVLALGGGIIQDLVTLAASLYMRGISWAYIPTTLTGMMDSCLGGKSSINVGKTKNLVGNIYPPSHIFVNTQFLNTLDAQSLTSGLAEGVKIAFARGEADFYNFVNNHSSTCPSNDKDTQRLIGLSLSAKKWFIEVDEFDKAERQLLNFGHSFGHAFEAASNFGVQHGLGVALGVIAACSHPEAIESPNSIELVKYCSGLVSRHLEIVKSAYELSNWEVFALSLKSDKKNTEDSLVLILPKEEGRLEKVYLPFSTRSIETATETMKSTLENILNDGALL